MTSTTLNQIERACAVLARDGHPITSAAVAEHAGSGSTIYRNPELRAIIEHHRSTAPASSITAITDELATLRQGRPDTRRHRPQPRRATPPTHPRLTRYPAKDQTRGR